MKTWPTCWRKSKRVAKEGEAELAAVGNADALEQFRIKYLGTKGGEGPDEAARPGAAGAEAGGRAARQRGEGPADGRVRGEESRRSPAAAGDERDAVDVTEPGSRPQLGNRHILMKVVDELTELFGRMGFSVASGPEVEDEFHNFVALNIPESHPAATRSTTSTSRETGEGRRGSTGRAAAPPHADQHRADPRDGEAEAADPRRDPRPRLSARHASTRRTCSMFHQLEALVVDENVTMVDLKSTVMQFVHAYFGPETKVRFRPSFFPFTEPSAEVDVWFEDKQKWIELGGCGMVHPNVLKAVQHRPGRVLRLGVRLRHRADRDAQVRDQRHPAVRRERRAVPEAVLRLSSLARCALNAPAIDYRPYKTNPRRRRESYFNEWLMPAAAAKNFESSRIDRTKDRAKMPNPRSRTAVVRVEGKRGSARKEKV